MKPRLLDLFCGAGGCSVGYARAGFKVVGVDISPQPNYPFEFIQRDALDLLGTLGGSRPFNWEETAGHTLLDFDAIHASPPCQKFSGAQVIRGRDHLDLLTPARERLQATGLPWVIENVEGAPMRQDVVLCGTMFGLGIPGRGYLQRHRVFELGGFESGLVSPCHHPPELRSVGVYGHTGNKGTGNTSGNHGWLVADWREAMGIDWMTRDELAQAIPPAYTELIGHQLMQHLTAALTEENRG